MTIELTKTARRNIEENLEALKVPSTEENVQHVASVAQLNDTSYAHAAKITAAGNFETEQDDLVPLSAEGLQQMANRWQGKAPRPPRVMDENPGSMAAVAEYYAAESAEGRTVLAALTMEEAKALQNARTDEPWDGSDGIWKLEMAELFERIGKANEEKGFHERGAQLLADYEAAGTHLAHSVDYAQSHDDINGTNAAAIELAQSDLAATVIALNTYLGDRLMLIVSELVEAQDELRKGHSFEHTYYPTTGVPQLLHKPEGFISELADVFIRLADLAQELKIIERLVEMVDEKLIYNASRPRKHGKKY